MNRLAGSASLAYYSVSFSGRRLSSLLGAEKSGNFMSLPRCIVRTLCRCRVVLCELSARGLRAQIGIYGSALQHKQDEQFDLAQVIKSKAPRQAQASRSKRTDQDSAPSAPGRGNSATPRTDSNRNARASF